MTRIRQEPASPPSCTFTEGRRRRDARDRAALAVAALEWAALAVMVLAFVAASAAMWLG